MDELSCKLNRTVCVCVRPCVCVRVFASSKGQAERLCHTPTSAQTCTSLVYHVHEIRASLRKTACSPGGLWGGGGGGQHNPRQRQRQHGLFSIGIKRACTHRGMAKTAALGCQLRDAHAEYKHE